MTPLDMLFIRACKSEYAHQRLRTLYCRFFLKTTPEAVRQVAIIARLSTLVDTYVPITTTKFLHDLALSHQYCPMETSEKFHIENVLINQIRFAHRGAFPADSRWPAWTKKPS